MPFIDRNIKLRRLVDLQVDPLSIPVTVDAVSVSIDNLEATDLSIPVSVESPAATVTRYIERNIKLRKELFTVESFSDAQRGETCTIVVANTTTAPTLANTAVAGLTVTAVNGNTITCSVPESLPRKHGAQAFDVTIAGDTVSAQTNVLPATGWTYVDVVDPSLEEGSAFNQFTGDAPQTLGQLVWRVNSIQTGLTASYLPSGFLLIDQTDSQDTSDVVITEDILIDVYYISPIGEIGSTASNTYRGPVDAAANDLSIGVTLEDFQASLSRSAAATDLALSTSVSDTSISYAVEASASSLTIPSRVEEVEFSSGVIRQAAANSLLIPSTLDSPAATVEQGGVIDAGVTSLQVSTSVEQVESTHEISVIADDIRLAITVDQPRLTFELEAKKLTIATSLSRVELDTRLTIAANDLFIPYELEGVQVGAFGFIDVSASNVFVRSLTPKYKFSSL